MGWPMATTASASGRGSSGSTSRRSSSTPSPNTWWAISSMGADASVAMTRWPAATSSLVRRPEPQPSSRTRPDRPVPGLAGRLSRASTERHGKRNLDGARGQGRAGNKVRDRTSLHDARTSSCLPRPGRGRQSPCGDPHWRTLGCCFFDNRINISPEGLGPLSSRIGEEGLEFVQTLISRGRHRWRWRLRYVGAAGRNL